MQKYEIMFKHWRDGTLMTRIGLILTVY